MTRRWYQPAAHDEVPPTGRPVQRPGTVAVTQRGDAPPADHRRPPHPPLPAGARPHHPRGRHLPQLGELSVPGERQRPVRCEVGAVFAPPRTTAPEHTSTRQTETRTLATAAGHGESSRTGAAPPVSRGGPPRAAPGVSILNFVTRTGVTEANLSQNGPHQRWKRPSTWLARARASCIAHASAGGWADPSASTSCCAAALGAVTAPHHQCDPPTPPSLAQRTFERWVCATTTVLIAALTAPPSPCQRRSSPRA
jgi:hypothetical protein